MKKTLLLSFMIFGAAAFASSSNKPFKVTLTQDSVIEGKAFKAGDYKVSVENGNAMIKQGKQVIEVPAREENDATKFESNSLVYQEDGKLSEVRIGGTHTKIVFDGDSSMHAGQ
jgi:hypothetical protein